MLLNVVSRRRVVREADDTSKSIQTIPHRKVDGFTEDAIPLIGVGDDLGVATADIQNDRVFCVCGQSSHFNVAHAMVRSYQRYLPEKGKSSRANSDRLKGRTHARTFCV